MLYFYNIMYYVDIKYVIVTLAFTTDLHVKTMKLA